METSFWTVAAAVLEVPKLDAVLIALAVIFIPLPAVSLLYILL